MDSICDQISMGRLNYYGEEVKSSTFGNKGEFI